MQTKRPNDWPSRAVSPADVVAHVKSGMKVFIHGACATPTALLDALAERRDVEGVELYHLHTSGPCRFTDEDQAGHFFSSSLFTGPSCRNAIADGRADYIPVFLSEIPWLFKLGHIPLDVALLQLSPPDSHGDCTLGPSVDAALAASQHAKLVLAEINTQMPRTTGNTVVPFHRVDAFTLSDRPLIESPPGEEGEVEAQIGEHIAALIEDGSTLQMGIGAIPDAVLARLGDKVDLGIHTEMFSDRVIDLVDGGVVTNRYKEIHRGRITTSFVAGTQRLFDFVDDNLKV
ncbi:MAG: 4-hydroxybutyrate CoA-transferase, partial [Polyangiaceae bacterium]